MRKVNHIVEAKIAKLSKHGVTVKQIAIELDLTTLTVSKYRKKLGIALDRNPRGSSILVKNKEEVLKLLADGWKQREIAKKYNVYQGSVSAFLKRLKSKGLINN